MGIGILTGITLSGPAAQAATEVLTASHTSQTFYVNGQKVEFKSSWAALPQTRSAAQLISPVVNPVERFVPILRIWWHPYLPADRLRCWPRVRPLRQGMDCASVYKKKTQNAAQETVAFLITLAAVYGYFHLSMVWCVVAKEANKMRNTDASLQRRRYSLARSNLIICRMFCDPAGLFSFEQIVGVHIDQPQIKRFSGGTGNYMLILDGVLDKPGTVFF